MSVSPEFCSSLYFLYLSVSSEILSWVRLRVVEPREVVPTILLNSYNIKLAAWSTSVFHKKPLITQKHIINACKLGELPTKLLFTYSWSYGHKYGLGAPTDALPQAAKRSTLPARTSHARLIAPARYLDKIPNVQQVLLQIFVLSRKDALPKLLTRRRDTDIDINPKHLVALLNSFPSL